MKSSIQRKHGFTLLELLVVVTILGVLATLIISRVTTTADSTRNSVDATNRSAINSAVERYYITEGSWPTDLTDLDGHSAYFPEGIPVSPVTNSTYTLNSTTHRVD